MRREHVSELTIAVIGDVMIDRYIDGTVTRVSPEDPTCLVLNSRKSVYTLGGAANVALNLAVLGAKVHLVGLGGSKDQEQLFMSVLDKSACPDDRVSVWLAETSRRMPIKTRYRAHGKQLLRVDYEEDRDPTTEEAEVLLSDIREALDESIDMVVLSDYRKGTLADNVLPALVDHLDKYHVPYVVDPKRADLYEYGEALAICPNEVEWAAAQARGARPLAHWVIVTRGEAGCTIEPWSDGVGIGGGAHQIATAPVEVCDPTGAGDTFISALAVGLSLSRDIESACTFANAAARISVMHPGAYAPTFEEIEGKTSA